MLIALISAIALTYVASMTGLGLPRLWMQALAVFMWLCFVMMLGEEGGGE